MKKISILFHMY